MVYHREGYDIYVSTRKNKKYDVYKDDKYITSFGDKNMQQYKDRLGNYSNLDHNDKQRRLNFQSRFKKLIEKNDPTSGIYWSAKFLW
jgi:hypothetical protein